MTLDLKNLDHHHMNKEANAMPLELANLDEATRRYALAELDFDLGRGALYLDALLNDLGRLRWPARLREALARHDDAWLANELRGLLVTKERVRRPMSREYVWRDVPHTAAWRLAEGEFNRFYIRGLCARCLAENQKDVVIYRARESYVPRAASEERIGLRIECAKLLDDLRYHSFVDPALGIPGGPNSGLSVKVA